jgi:predicted double-glycine peptidase
MSSGTPQKVSIKLPNNPTVINLNIFPFLKLQKYKYLFNMGKKFRLNQSELVNLIKEIVNEVERPKILDVPHFIQTDDSTCGPASLKMVFAYYGKDLTEKQIAYACNHTYEFGCQGEDMVCAANHFGFNVFLKNNSTIKDIERYIDMKIPVIVDWFCGDPPEGHSSVVIGYSEKNLYILDPWLEEMRIVTKSDFRRCWFDFRETPITPENLYVGQVIVITPKK